MGDRFYLIGRLTPALDTEESEAFFMSREQIEHFETWVKSYPEGNKLTRDNFVSEQTKIKGFENWYTDDALENHLDELKKPYIANAMLSYDINMRYLDTLDQKCFDAALKLLRVHFQMKEVTMKIYQHNINDWKCWIVN